MKVNEAKRIGKLSDEILLFLVANHHSHVILDVSIKEEEIVLSVTTSKISPTNKEKLVSGLSVPRNLAIEEYGWELLGESEVSVELDLVGMCFDTFDLIETSEMDVIRLGRRFKTNP
ncbi:MAG: hypothetical protein ACRCTA_05495 [Bacilli bacterium]